MTSLLILFVQRRSPLQTGLLLGFAVHFKIYPVIYAPTILLALDEQYDRLVFPRSEEVIAYGDHQPTTYPALLSYINKSRILFSIGTTIGFLTSTIWMYQLYSHEFIQHTYLHHFSRLDHRHNFSPYHLILYLSSALPKETVSITSLAFIPQLLLVGVVIPLALYGKDLATTLFAQTFAFVAFNKVCTSQVSPFLIPLKTVFYVVYFVSTTISSHITISSISQQGCKCSCGLDYCTGKNDLDLSNGRLLGYITDID
jgi:GPI mannosyltransferase 1 subunit M